MNKLLCIYLECYQVKLCYRNQTLSNKLNVEVFDNRLRKLMQLNFTAFYNAYFSESIAMVCNSTVP